MSVSPSIIPLLDTVIKEGGSDLHLSVGSHPIIRVSGSLVPLVQHPILKSEDTQSMLKEILAKEKWETFAKDQAVDFSYAHNDNNRFRVNGYVVQGSVTVAMRLIPKQIRSFTSLNLPTVLEVFIQRI